MKMQDAHPLGVPAFCGHQVYTVPVYLHVNGYVLASSRLRKNSLVHWAKPAENTIFVGVSELPAGQEKQRRDRKSHVTSR